MLYLSGNIGATFWNIRVSEGVIIYIDVADLAGITPEGDDGWTTIWIANQFTGADYDLSKLIGSLNGGSVPSGASPASFSVDAGIVLHEFNPQMKVVVSLFLAIILLLRM